MGHAVMGTAIGSGANRAVDAAQLAMASPLLEEGAIDGARGILINITGSSSLKLSEVNAASTLIQSAAHEDANIIFGAVQDEKMGDEVKITVIATGFRDQMPERRARMLNVEETPVISVPVATPGNWLDEHAAAPTPAPDSSRFLSQDEEEDEALFFSSSTPAVATTVNVAAPDAISAEEPEPATVRERPRFEELCEEPIYTPLPRDYASEFDAGPRALAAVEERRAQPAATLFSEANNEVQRDLDVPTVMRRSSY
jgi:cell division protein FtsZ